MILKGKQSFFDLPGVETVSGELGPRRPEERSVITQAVVYIVGAARRAKGPVSLDIVERTADEAARAGNGKREGAENAPILELRLYQEPETRTEEEVFHLSYDAELRFLISQGKITKNLVPTSFTYNNRGENHERELTE